MEWRSVLVMMGLLFFSACGGSNDTVTTMSSPGDYNQTISVGGTEREYILHIPSGYDGSHALPLMFVLHGHGMSAASMVRLTGMNEKADQENFFVVYLEGTLGSDGKLGWNTGITPDNNIGVDDVAFVRQLANQLEEGLNVDTKRIYAAGFSNGGMMTHRLGAELSDILAGVAVAGGTIGTQQTDGTWLTIPETTGPVSVIIFHGKQDSAVPYYGQSYVEGGHTVKSAADTFAYWAEADGCTSTPQSFVSADGNIITEDYQACAEGSEVELLTIVSGEHQWPTLENTSHFSATDATWDFFSRHSKSNL